MRGFLSSRRIGHADSQPQFFYTNAVYDQAYKAISSALRAQKGLILLIGDAGTGKTKLMGDHQQLMSLLAFYRRIRRIQNAQFAPKRKCFDAKLRIFGAPML